MIRTSLMRLFLSPIRNNILFYVAMVALFSISIINIEYGRCSRMRAGLEMFGDVYILCAIINLIPLRFRQYVKALVFVLLFIIGLIDLTCYTTMGTALCPNIIQTWMQTNSQEASEALGLHWESAVSAIPVLLMLLLPFVLIYLRRLRITIPQWGLVCLFLTSMVSIAYGINNKRYLYHVYSRVSDDDMEEFAEYETMTHEYLPIYRALLSAKEISRFSNMSEHLLRNVQTTACDTCTQESPLMVLLIGESYNRHHASLYGYEKPTTPLQEKLEQNGRLFKYDNVISSYNLTFKSLQNMLTFYNYDSEGNWYDYTIIPALFRKAGYEVGFFSNQYTIKKRFAFSDYCEDVFMNDYELSQYLFDRRNDESHPYDMELLDDYRRLCSTEPTKPQFLIFHFMGLHADFKLRYPEQEKLFHGSDYQRPDLTTDDKEILADYDNAIAYNDKVVNAIVEEFSDKDAVIIYAPDHGELVFDGCNAFGRQLQSTKAYVIPQYDIPFWIVCSESYETNHPQICQQIRNSQHRPFMTDDLPHLLVYLAGIQCKDYRPERNLVDDAFDISRKRMLGGETDYDLL